MILKKAKGSGSSTSRRSTTKGLDASQHSESAKRPSRSRAILQSAADITGRLSQRSTRKKPRSGKGSGISKGQKAFYRSSKGICKVTVVGVHHDAKLEPYYTIKLRDGKEKQVGGKHLTPVQDVEKSIKKDSSSRHVEKSDQIKKGSRGSSHGEGVAKSVTVESKKGSTTGTDQTFDSTSEEGSAEASSEDNALSDLDAQFAKGQNVYYCSSDGHVSKVKVLKVYSSSSSSKHKYSVHLPDGTSKDVDDDQLKALIDLTSDELAVFMKEKNEKPSSSKEISALALTEDVDPGYEAGKSESSQETAEQNSSDGNQKPLALPCSFEMVEAKTEEGGTKMVPRYAARTKLYYKNADGVQMATILESHLDDLLDPYYSIRLADGREKQTDNAHLLMTLPEGEGAEVKKEEQDEEMKQETEVAMEESEESKERESPTSETMVEEKALDTQAKQETVAEQSKETNKSETLKSETSDVGQEATPKVKMQVDPAASALTLVHNFSLREVVLYSSSQGEHYRATVVKLLKDKKHRPYYVVRLPDGKEKQVYDHRLSPTRIGRADTSVDESKRSGRSRSANRSATRRRSLSEAPSSSRKTLSRADSNDSHNTPNTWSRRASISSDEKKKSFSRSMSLSRRSLSRGPRSQSRARSRSRARVANEDAKLGMRSLRKSIR